MDTVDPPLVILLGASIVASLSTCLQGLNILNLGVPGLSYDNEEKLNCLYANFKRRIAGKNNFILIISPLFNSFFPGRNLNGHYIRTKQQLPGEKMFLSTKQFVEKIISLCPTKALKKVLIAPTPGRRFYKCKKDCTKCIKYPFFGRKVCGLYKRLSNEYEDQSKGVSVIQYKEWAQYHIENFGTRKYRKMLNYHMKQLKSGNITDTYFDRLYIVYMSRMSTFCAGCLVDRQNPAVRAKRHYRKRKKDQIHFCCSLSKSRYGSFLSSYFDTDASLELRTKYKFDRRTR